MTGVRGRGDRASRPAWKSSNAWASSARVFMTNGPYAATGSRIGSPPSSRTSMSPLGPAANVIASPAPNTASCPIRTGLFSAPTVPDPAST